MLAPSSLLFHLIPVPSLLLEEKWRGLLVVGWAREWPRVLMFLRETCNYIISSCHSHVEMLLVPAFEGHNYRFSSCFWIFQASFVTVNYIMHWACRYASLQIHALSLPWSRFVCTVLSLIMYCCTVSITEPCPLHIRSRQRHNSNSISSLHAPVDRIGLSLHDSLYSWTINDYLFATMQAACWLRIF